MTALVVFEKIGDTRRRTITLPKGSRIDLVDKGTMVTTTAVLMDVTEVYEHENSKAKTGEKAWRIASYFTESARLPPSTRWQRFKAWLLRRPVPSLPVAKVEKQRSLPMGATEP